MAITFWITTTDRNKTTEAQRNHISAVMYVYPLANPAIKRVNLCWPEFTKILAVGHTRLGRVSQRFERLQV